MYIFQQQEEAKLVCRLMFHTLPIVGWCCTVCIYFYAFNQSVKSLFSAP